MMYDSHVNLTLYILGKPHKTGWGWGAEEEGSHQFNAQDFLIYKVLLKCHEQKFNIAQLMVRTQTWIEMLPQEANVD